MSNLSLRCADNIRILAASMVEKAKSGHPGGPMGGADFVHVLYTDFLNYDPTDMAWPLRDRFFLDAGHMSAMLYAQQTLLGKYSMDDIQNFRQWGSPTPGHPELDVQRGIENTSGPLGLGHTFGVGAAIAERFLAARFGETVAHKTYLYISDGGVQEEISQSAGRIAGHLGLGNIVMFYDANDIQLSTEVNDVTSEDTAKKYEAWGWQVLSIPGNDHDAIRSAIKAGLAETERPTLIIGKTLMGLGTRKADGSMFEGEVELHGQPLTGAGGSFEKTVEGLGGDSAKPFQIFPDVAERYAAVVEQKTAAAKKRKAAFKIWAKENPALAEKFAFFLTGKLPEINWQDIQIKANDATRNASGAVLGYLAGRVENMIVSSADLANSDKTENFLKKTGAFKRNDFSGAFLQAGVSELTMAAMAVGMSLHGGVLPACATFFAFSDYMKPAMRVAALMETPVVFLWTHDAFRVGEDGPTHQPVEHMAALRAIPGLNVFRPAEGVETAECWELALSATGTPSILALTRQAVPNLRASTTGPENMCARGGYVLREPEGKRAVTLIATGSELGLAAEAADALAKDGIAAAVVSMPSFELFRKQTDRYRAGVLGEAPRIAIEAGVVQGWHEWLRHTDRFIGMTGFGASAPAPKLYEHFGITTAKVVEAAKGLVTTR